MESTWYPQIMNFNRVFPYKPSILGSPIFGNTHMVIERLQKPQWPHPSLLSRKARDWWPAFAACARRVTPMGRIELPPKMNQFHVCFLKMKTLACIGSWWVCLGSSWKNKPCHPGDRVICQMWMFDHSSNISCSVSRIYTRYLHSGSKTSISMHYLFSQACTSATHGQFSW